MAISERIHFFRNLRGMTQKYLGLQLGFPDKSADVRTKPAPALQRRILPQRWHKFWMLHPKH
mgnify:CR=1 FL=1